MNFAEILPWFNVAIVPALVYIVKLERRIIKLEVMLAVHLGLDQAKLERVGV